MTSLETIIDDIEIKYLKSINSNKAKNFSVYNELQSMLCKKSNTNEGNFYDTYSGKYISLNDYEIRNLYNYAWQIVELGGMDNKKYTTNSNKHYISVVELPNRYSNFVYYVDTTKVAGYITSANYKFYDEKSSIKKLDYYVKKSFKVFAKFANISKCKIAIYVKFSEAKLTYKFHYLDYKINFGLAAEILNGIKSLKMQLSDIPAYTCNYNEIYQTTVLPYKASWQLYRIINCECDDTFSNFESQSTYDFVEECKDCMDVFSVNGCELKATLSKEFVTSKFDIANNQESENDYALVKMKSMLKNILIKNSNVRFINLIIISMEKELRKNILEYESFITKFNKEKEYKFILKYYYLYWFSGKTEEDFKKLWDNKNQELFDIGYYYYMAKRDCNFKENYEEFINTLLYDIIYECNGRLKSGHIVDVLKYIYCGKYQSYKSGRDYITYKYCDKYDYCSPGQLYKWEIDCDFRHVIKKLMSLYTKLKDIIAEISINNDKSKIDPNNKKKDPVQKMLDSLETVRINLKDGSNETKIINHFVKSTINNQFEGKLDIDGDVIGTYNGLLKLNFDDCSVTYMQEYSKHYVSMCVNAEYESYEHCKKHNKYYAIWKQIFKDTFPEKDARGYTWYYASTMIEAKYNVMRIYVSVGGGSNGKSSVWDNVIYLLSEYANKLSANLIIGKTRSGVADPELMQMRNKRGNLIAETDPGDVAVGSRIKTITERVKTGRDLFATSTNFEGNNTVVICTNFHLRITDCDDGTWRRIDCYNHKVRYTENPDPNNSAEKKANRSYETLARDHPEAANALFSILVHKRMKFHKLYNSNFDKYNCATIRSETAEYRNSQDFMSRYISTRIVVMYGYKENGNIREGLAKEDIINYYSDNALQFQEEFKLYNIVQDYIEWYKQLGSELKESYDIIKNKFLSSKLKNYLVKVSDCKEPEYILKGFRIIGKNKSKLKEEYYLF